MLPHNPIPTTNSSQLLALPSCIMLKRQQEVIKMNTTTRKPGFAHRIGRAIRRGWDKLNQFELGVARRVGKAYPSFGFRATRILFLLLKLAVLAVLAIVSAYIVLCVFLFLAFIALVARPEKVEVTNWDDLSSGPNFVREGCGFDQVDSPYRPGDWG